MKTKRRFFNWVVTVSLLLTGVGLPINSSMPAASAQDSNASSNSLKVMVDVRAAGARRQAAALGGQLLQDYGAFSVWSVPDRQAATLAKQGGVTLRPDFDTIGLRSGAIDTQAGRLAPDVPANLRETAGSGAQFWLVQYAGPIKSEWLTELKASGLEAVMYMPNNAYVVWGEAPQAKLAALAGRNRMIQWTGAYHPAYRLSPDLRKIADKGSANEWVDVTAQFYTTSATQASLGSLLKLGGEVRRSPERILGFTNTSLQVPADKLIELANWPDVFNVEQWVAPQKLDEIQDQILAGNVISSSGAVVPNSPGYIAWLASKGFPTTPSSYPIVDIVDDGIDQGNANNVLHPDFHELGVLANPDRVVYIGNCTSDASGSGVDGHGNLNAGIVGSYNDLSGFPYVDANGYRIGLGVSPYGRIAGTKIFANGGSWDISACSSTIAGIVAASYNAGAQLTSNSWGANAYGAYNSDAQAYDQLTRDASSTAGGNQEMLHVFSAGNAGSSAGTIGSPATAKNVLAVGATENVRGDGVFDGLCGVSAANNADDMATFSSRGPTNDGRYKPEISAPGTHVQGPASQDPNFNGSGVCGGPSNDGYPPPTDAYYPAGQTLYTWSSGTSHSAPAIAGTASLAWNYYTRVLQPGATPSPAMLKALLLNSTRYLQGADTGGTLPSNTQGWGDANLGTLFDGTPRVLVDQSRLFTASGQEQFYYGSIMNPGKLFRVTLAWTDAPGSTTGNAYVNNLDLEVTVNGVTYKGNVFSGPDSIADGAADAKNNVESVFLPAGASGGYTVRVVAANLAGDGVPGSGTATDQDYALVIYNNSIGPAGTLQGQVSSASTGDPIAGAQVSVYAVPTQTYTLAADADGNYSILLGVGSYTVTGSAYGYLPSTVTGVGVVSGTTTTQNIALAAAPSYVVSGTVKDATAGWPLYARINIDGYPGGAIWTDPVTGFYSITLVAGIQYRFDVTAFSAGYNSAGQNVGPLIGGATIDLGLNVDAVKCNAPGYAPGATGLLEPFNSPITLPGSAPSVMGLLEPFNSPITPPGTSDWTIDSAGKCPWRFDDPGSRGNLTGGADGFAIADSDFCGSGAAMSTTLTSPAVDVSPLTSVTLAFNYDYNNNQTNEIAAADVSADNGATWKNVVTWNTDQRGPALFSQDVTSLLSGATQAKLRFRYVAPGWNWWWEVDNALLGEQKCLPQSGGLVVGSVYDANTGSALPGATVVNDRGGAMTTTITADPAVDDSFYTLFSPSGSHTFTATTSGNYGSDVQTPTVVTSGTVRQDFNLPAGRLSYDPPALEATLDVGESATLLSTLTNSGAVSADFQWQERDHGSTLLGLSKPNGTITWLTRTLTGVPVTASDNGATLAYPGAYRYTPAHPSADFNVLVYTDDWVHITPNTLVQQALARLGLAATVYVDDNYTGFETALTSGGPWDLVVWSGESYSAPSSTLTALRNYLRAGGKLAATYWNQLGMPADPLWAEMGFEYVTNYLDARPVYWWDAAHPIFNTPESAPEWLVRFAPSGYSQGTLINPLANSTAVGGYTIVSTPGQAALTIRNDGKAVYKAIRDITTDADADADLVLDGVELWENIIDGLLNGFSNDVPWLSEVPISGTVAAMTSQPVAVTFDAGAPEITQPGQYFAQLTIKHDTPYDVAVIPVTMTVTPPETWGKLDGTVTGSAACDTFTSPLDKASVLLQNGSGLTWTVTTNTDGAYRVWLDEDNSPLTMTISAGGFVTQTVTGIDVTAQQTTTQDINLRLNAPCLSVEPASLDVTVELGLSETAPLTLTNSGAGTATFQLQEQGENFTPLKAARLPVFSEPGNAFFVNGVASEQPGPRATGIKETAVQDKAHPLAASLKVINFDDLPQPCGFNSTVALGNEYQSQGVIFNGPGGNDGGAILDTCGNFGVSGYSPPNFLAFNSGTMLSNGGIPRGPEEITFIGTASYVQISAGSGGFGQPITLEAFDSVGNSLGSNTIILGAALQPLQVSANGITRVVISTSASVFVLDDLTFDGSMDVPWLSEAPITGTISANGGSLPIAVTFDASVPEVSQPGDYFATLRVKSNDPVNPHYAVPVTMTVTPPATWGKLKGVVNGLEACNINPAPMPDAVVYVENGAGYTRTLTTGADGAYTLWLNEANSPLTVTVSNEAGYEAQTASGILVTAQQTTTHNVNLRLYAPCASVTPGQLSSAQLANQVATKTLTISNTGASSFDWDIAEKAAGQQTQLTGSADRLRLSTPQQDERSGQFASLASKANAVQDGGFEATDPATYANPYWSQSSTVFSSVLCNAACGTGGGTAGPRFGSFWAWFGGGVDNYSYLAQTIVLTSNPSILSFWVWVGVAATGRADYMRVYIDWTPVYTANVSVATSGYVLVNVDITAFADGNAHVLEFVSYTTAGGNISLDNVAVNKEYGPTCQPNSVPWASALPVSGAAGADSQTPVNVTFNSTGLATGNYTGALCVNMDDPLKPWMLVPVNLAVLSTYVITPAAGLGGSITPGTPQTVNYGDSQTFTITANTGYHILDAGVDGASVGAVNVYTFTNVTASHTLTAAFAINTYTLTPTAGANGSITPGTPQTVNYGDSQTFAIAANTGYHILDVGADGSSVGAVSAYTFTNVTANHTLTAAFTSNPVSLTVNVMGSGAVSQTPQSPYFYGDAVTLTANAATNWAFAGWSGDLNNTTNPVTITLTGDKVVTATFASTCVPVNGVDFTYTPIAPKAGQTVTFNSAALTGTAPITYTWNYGDDSAVGSGSPITHLFPITLTTRTYTVTLTAANACGTVPALKSLTIQPQAVFLPLVKK